MIGRLDTAAKRAGSLPEPLWCWCQVLIGIPNKLPGPHSKLCLRPSGASTVVAPRPDNTYTSLSCRCFSSFDATPEIYSVTLHVAARPTYCGLVVLTKLTNRADRFIALNRH